MSRNNKNVRKKSIAKQFTQARKSGGKGPARTACKHNKVKAWYRTGKFRTSQPAQTAQPEE